MHGARSEWREIGLKGLMTSLLLQKPSPKSKNLENKKQLVRRLDISISGMFSHSISSFNNKNNSQSGINSNKQKTF